MKKIKFLKIKFYNIQNFDTWIAIDDIMEKRKVITLGAGCFWCVEAVFQRLKGVTSATSGYMGGKAETANYKAVCSGDSGHIEVVRVEYQHPMTTESRILTSPAQHLPQHPRPHLHGPPGRGRWHAVPLHCLL